MRGAACMQDGGRRTHGRHNTTANLRQRASSTVAYGMHAHMQHPLCMQHCSRTHAAHTHTLSCIQAHDHTRQCMHAGRQACACFPCCCAGLQPSRCARIEEREKQETQHDKKATQLQPCAVPRGGHRATSRSCPLNPSRSCSSPNCQALFKSHAPPLPASVMPWHASPPPQRALTPHSDCGRGCRAATSCVPASAYTAYPPCWLRRRSRSCTQREGWPAA